MAGGSVSAVEPAGPEQVLCSLQWLHCSAVLFALPAKHKLKPTCIVAARSLFYPHSSSSNSRKKVATKKKYKQRSPCDNGRRGRRATASVCIKRPRGLPASFKAEPPLAPMRSDGCTVKQVLFKCWSCGLILGREYLRGPLSKKGNYNENRRNFSRSDLTCRFGLDRHSARGQRHQAQPAAHALGRRVATPPVGACQRNCVNCWRGISLASRRRPEGLDVLRGPLMVGTPPRPRHAPRAQPRAYTAYSPTPTELKNTAAVC